MGSSFVLQCRLLFPPRSCSIQAEITHLPPCLRRLYVRQTGVRAFQLRCVRLYSFVHICVILVSYTPCCRPHPSLITVWSIAGCCDAVRGEPCRSRGTVTFRRIGITLLTFLLWLEFRPRFPRDDLTLFTLHWDAGGCSKLIPLLHPPPSLFPTTAVHFWNTLRLHFSFSDVFFFFFFTCSTSFYFLQAWLHLAFKLLLHSSLHVTESSIFLSLAALLS